MKKVLFATTALVAGALATPQVASAQSVSAGNADISFGGYARFGLMFTDPEGGSSSTDITSRYRLQIDASAESDAGVTFGARVRIERDAGEVTIDDLQAGDVGAASDIEDLASSGINGPRFFVRTGGLEVGVGNIYGALEFMPGQYPIDLGLTGLGYDYTAFNFRGDAYNSDSAGAGNRNGVEVIYNMGDFGVHLSASEGANDRVALVVDYTVSGWTFAVGAQDSDDDADTEFTASAGGSVGPADVTLAYADNGTGGDHWVLAGSFDVGASTNVEAFFADADSFTDDNAYGVDFNHAMGGGTSLRGGIVKRGNGATQADFGVRFNF